MKRTTMTLAALMALSGLAIANPAERIPSEITAESQSRALHMRPKQIPLPREAIDLSKIPFKLVHETYRETEGRKNWEIFMRNADGSNPVNLTHTPDVDEMYPHVSPDGTKISFVVDAGLGRNRVRHVYYMNIDGSDRVHVAEHAREPCWCFDSKSIAYLTDEYKRFSTREYATDALMFYYLEHQWTRPHVNTDLHHLYAISWSPDGKWFLAAVSGGMGYSDAIIAFDAFGPRVFDLAAWGVKGCRPEFSLDGTQMVWGETDWNLQIADIDITGPEPRVSNIREIVRCDRGSKVYHVDLSPDSQYVAFSYGPSRGGQQVGGMAEGWNLCIGDLTGKWVQITDDGFHNKEPDWVPIP
jgi:Tol biopolymer transport system component